MTSKTDIWMPVYIGDYLSATTRLTTEQHGAYLLLLMDYWKNGPPPDNDQVLAQITRMTPDAWSNARSIIQAFFEQCDGHWKHSRVERELADAADRKVVQSARAKAGAQARWAKNASSNAQAMLDDMLVDASSPSPSPTTPNGVVNRPAKRATQLDPDFLPNDVGLNFAASKGVNLATELEAFKNYHHAKGTTMKDWQAAWRTWCGNAVRFGNNRPAARQTIHDERKATLDALTGRSNTHEQPFTIDAQATRVA